MRHDVGGGGMALWEIGVPRREVRKMHRFVWGSLGVVELGRNMVMAWSLEAERVRRRASADEPWVGPPGISSNYPILCRDCQHAQRYTTLRC